MATVEYLILTVRKRSGERKCGTGLVVAELGDASAELSTPAGVPAAWPSETDAPASATLDYLKTLGAEAWHVATYTVHPGHPY
jgi:hypothetical protein